MKRKLVWITLLVIMTTVIPISANSGPVYWRGYPSFNILSIEENSTIRVDKENLVFDFSNGQETAHTISGKVTASYEMVNPTNQLITAQMAFPFVGKISSLLPEEIAINVDSQAMPFDLYIGNVVNSNGNFQKNDEVTYDFANIVSSITSEAYQPENFALNQKGKLYTITVKPTTEQRINFAIDFNLDHEKSKILTNGFNRYERNDDETRIAAWCYTEEQLEILLLGEDIELTINSYSDGELKEKSDLVAYQISTKEVEVKQYLMDFIDNNFQWQGKDMFSENQLFNLYAKVLDKQLTQNMGYCSEDDLMPEEHFDRIFTLVYSVEFPARSKKEVTVSYKAMGTMDKRETVKPQYSFEYLLNPAKNWAQFKDIKIEVIPPQEAPYLIKSNIDFTKENNQFYKATLADLPEEDLFFTLYENEKITIMDKINGTLHRSFGYLYPIILGAIVFLFIGVAILFILKYNLKK